MNMNKLALSGVVATALLLVVAVASIVSFQGWYSTYSSQLLNEVDQKSSSQIAQTGIETLNGDKLYFKNGQNSNLSIDQIKIDNIDCNVSGQFEPGVSTIDVSTCISNITTPTPEIVVFTNDNIISEKVFVENSNITSPSFMTPSINYTLIGNFTWNRTINDSLNRIQRIAIDSNNNILLAGVAGLEYFYLGKFDTNGNHLWNISESQGSSSGVRGVDVDSNDNIYVTYQNYTGYLVHLEKYSPTGNLLWERIIYNGSDSFIGKEGSDLEINSQNEVYVSVPTRYNDGGIASLYKYDSSGNRLWNITYNYVSEFGKTIQLGLDSNENPIMLFSGVSSNFDFYSVATDPSSNLLWDNVFDEGSESEYPDDICTTTNGRIYMVGRTGGTSRYIKIVEYDESGNEIQDATIGTRRSGSLTVDCDVFSNNDLLIHSVDYGNDFIDFKRLNSSLDITWEKEFDLGQDVNQLNAVSLDNNDNIIIGIKLSDSNINFLGKID